MSRIPFLLVGGLLLASLGAGASPQLRPRADDVWIQWSLAENLRTREELEQANFELPPAWAQVLFLTIVNGRAQAIENATLVVLHRGADIDLNLSETQAGDPPQRLYAYWREVGPNSSKLVLLNLRTGHSSGAFEIDFLVLFESGGEAFHSLVRTKGAILAENSVPANVFPGLLLLAGLAGRRRRTSIR